MQARGWLRSTFQFFQPVADAAGFSAFDAILSCSCCGKAVTFDSSTFDN
jgi:hypothetical protein